MATARNKRKLAALNKENCEELPKSNLAQNSIVAKSQEEDIAQVSEENDSRVTKMLSQEFSRTESRILGTIFNPHDFLLDPLIQGYSGTTPDASRNTLSTNQWTNEDDLQSDSHPEANVSQSQTTRNSGPDDTYDSCLLFCQLADFLVLNKTSFATEKGSNTEKNNIVFLNELPDNLQLFVVAIERLSIICQSFYWIHSNSRNGGSDAREPNIFYLRRWLLSLTTFHIRDVWNHKYKSNKTGVTSSLLLPTSWQFALPALFNLVLSAPVAECELDERMNTRLVRAVSAIIGCCHLCWNSPVACRPTWTQSPRTAMARWRL